MEDQGLGDEPILIHCMDLDNLPTCSWIVKGKQLWSYQATFGNVPFAFRNITEIPISELRDKFHDLNIGLGSMRSMLLFQGSIIRSGLDLGFGLENPIFLDRSHYPQILERSENELRFEEIRRLVAPNAPSRLTCIFAAEDTFEQRLHLGQMLGYIKRPYILKFRPKVVLNAFVADSSFYDLYAETKDIKHIVSYWKGIKNPSADKNSHEILYEGVLEAIDDEEIEHVRNFGAFQEWNYPPA